MLRFLRHAVLAIRSFLYRHGFFAIHDAVRNIGGAYALTIILIGVMGAGPKTAVIISLAVCVAKEAVDIFAAWPGSWEYFKNNSLPDLGYRILGVALAVAPIIAQGGKL